MQALCRGPYDASKVQSSLPHPYREEAWRNAGSDVAGLAQDGIALRNKDGQSSRGEEDSRCGHRSQGYDEF